MDLVMGTFSGLAIGFTIAVLMNSLQILANLRRTERLVNLLVKHHGIDVAQLAIDEATTPARAGRKIEAIKAYRDLTGCDLVTAKNAVESIK